MKHQIPIRRKSAKKREGSLALLLRQTIARKMATRTFRRFLVGYVLSMLFAVWMIASSDVGQRAFNTLFFAFNDYPRAYVPCEVAFNLDDQNLLELKILIPCKDKRQEMLLRQKLSRIKNDIVTGADNQIAEYIRRKDMTALKSELTAVVNKKLPHPVKTIYFQNLISSRVLSL